MEGGTGGRAGFEGEGERVALVRIGGGDGEGQGLAFVHGAVGQGSEDGRRIRLRDDGFRLRRGRGRFAVAGGVGGDAVEGVGRPQFAFEEGLAPRRADNPR